MGKHRTPREKRAQGFTLIELMIVVAIMGGLAALAVPTFMTYRIKSRIAASVGTGESIRAALASFAADSPGNLFPATAVITDYASLRTAMNQQGATLPATGSFTLDHYTRFDTDGDGVDDGYSMRLGDGRHQYGRWCSPFGHARRRSPAVHRCDNGELSIATGMVLRGDARENVGHRPQPCTPPSRRGTQGRYASQSTCQDGPWTPPEETKRLLYL